MNRLEQYISDNKSLFDDEPEAGHFERLLQKMNPKRGRIILLRRLSVAASIIILLSAGIGIFWHHTAKQNVFAICENVSDMKICFLDKMHILANEIEELIKDFDQWDKQIVKDDVKNIIDSINDDFESELPEELPESITKAILADYYRQNLEGLKMIATELGKRD